MDDFKILVESPTEIEASIANDNIDDKILLKDGSSKYTKDSTNLTPDNKLSTKNNKDISDFLSAVGKSSEKFEKAFYTEPVPARSWMQLQNDDLESINSHHRSDLFPQAWQPLGHPPSPPISTALSTIGKHKLHLNKLTGVSSKINNSESSGKKKKKLSPSKSDHTLPTPSITMETNKEQDTKDCKCDNSSVASSSPPLTPILPKRIVGSLDIGVVTSDIVLTGDNEDKPTTTNVTNKGPVTKYQVPSSDMFPDIPPIIYPSIISDSSIKSALKSSIVTHSGERSSFDSGKTGSSAKVAFILGADDIELTEPPPPPPSSSSSPSTTNMTMGNVKPVVVEVISPHKYNKPKRHGSRYKSGSRVFGSDVYLEGTKHMRSFSMPTEGADDLTEENIRHLNVMATHRFENSKGLRHRKIDKKSYTSTTTNNNTKNVNNDGRRLDKRLLDVVIHEQQQRFATIPEEDAVNHHEMFVELDELHMGDNNEWEWREKARWIKYEEDVEEDACKWSKPHVSSLSFHSLVELRRCIELGAMILDLDADDLPSIASRIVDQLVITDQLTEGDKPHVLQALLLKHKHLSEQQSFMKRTYHQQNLTGLSSSQTTPNHMYNSYHVNRNNNNSNNNNAFNNNNNNNNNYNNNYNKSNNNNNNNNNAGGVSYDNNNNNNNNNNNDDDEKDVDSMMRLLGDTAMTSPTSSSSSTPHVPMTVIKESKTADVSALYKIDKAMTQTSSCRSLPSSPTISTTTTTTKHSDGAPHIWKRIPLGAEATNVLVGTAGFLSSPISAFVRLKNAICLGNVTEVPLPVRFIFLLMGPDSNSLDYHEIGRSLSTLMADEQFHDAAYVATNRSDILDSLNEFLNDSVVLPPGEWDKKTLLPIVNITRQRQKEKKEMKRKVRKVKEPPSYDPLKRQGRLFGGLIEDVRKRYPYYLSDIIDGLNLQCLAALIFVYFACLSPAITFGGLLGEKTDKLMGVNEMLVATAICGVVFSLAAGQPLIIIGATGPVLVFEEALYKICVIFDLEFLPFRFWVGVWVSIICTIVVALEGSVLVRFITRFTEEIFALLISLIFIYEVFKKLFYVFKKNPLLEYYPYPNDTHMILNNNHNNNNNTYYNNTYNSNHVMYNNDNNNNSGKYFSSDGNNLRISKQDTNKLINIFNNDNDNNNNINNIDNINNKLLTTASISDIILSTYFNHNNNNNNYNRGGDDINHNNNNNDNYSDYYNNYTFSDSRINVSAIGGDAEGASESHPYVPHPNTALLSVILTFGTFLLAYSLKKFRNSKFLGRNARRAIGDFGVPISIMVVALTDYLIPNTHTEKLDIPEGFTPTAPHLRSWVINPLGTTTTLPPWSMFVAVVPSVLIFILLYMESVITSMIVNKKDRLLKKGSGYHLDLFVTGLCASICGLLGLPFMCSATVRSVTHVSALSVFSRTHAPGVKPHLVNVVEQRVTSLAVHLLVGVSILMGPVLKQVPLAVLFGIFLYMGIASMTGIQLLKRLKLMFMPSKHHPDVGYVKRVRLWKMNLFTCLQLMFLALLWVIKSTKGALAFPFILILIVPVRIHVFKWFFTELELNELDKEEDCPSEDEELEPDFYTQAHMPI